MHSDPSALHPSHPLLWALAASIVLHAALLASGPRLFTARPEPARTPDAALRVKLTEPPAALAQPRLLRREDTPPRPAAKASKAASTPVSTLARAPASPIAALVPAAGGVRALAGEAARSAGEQIARELFYPPEAIERGQEGEALVLLFLDAAGNAIAARIESSSGHALLDAAAVRAARTLRSLPSSAPREALVPVRFRLR